MFKVNKMDSLTELQTVEAKISQLEQEADALKAQQRQSAISCIQADMTKYGITLRDLQKGIKYTRSGKPRKKIHPKYQNPETGATWTGLGRSPVWLLEAAARGVHKDAFLIVETIAKENGKEVHLIKEAE